MSAAKRRKLPWRKRWRNWCRAHRAQLYSIPIVVFLAGALLDGGWLWAMQP